MKKLVIGATGNVGFYTVRKLRELGQDIKIATRDVTRAKDKLTRFGNLEYVYFDFYNPNTFLDAIQGVDSVLLIKPSTISGIKKILSFIDFLVDCNVTNIVFVSMMDVEKNKLNNSLKIEEYIKSKNMNYTILRPNIFMENLLYPHGKEIKVLSKILIPAGSSKISLVSSEDVGEVAGVTLTNRFQHLNKTYTLTGEVPLSYSEVAKVLSEILERKIVYANPSFSLYKSQLKENEYDKGYIYTFITMYTMARLGTMKVVTNDIETILNRRAITIREFAYKHKVNWLSSKDFLLNREI